MTNVLIENANGKDKRVQRILVVHNGSPSGAAIESSLIHQADLDVLGIAPDVEAQLLQVIKRYQPDVIVLDKASDVTSLNRLVTLLPNYPRLRLVEVSSENDLVQIYDKQEVLVTQAADLTTIISHQ